MENFQVDSQFFSELAQLYPDGTSCPTIAGPTVRKYNRTKPIAPRKNRPHPVEEQVDLASAECPQQRQGLARDTRIMLQNPAYTLERQDQLPAFECPAKRKRHATSASNLYSARTLQSSAHSDVPVGQILPDGAPAKRPRTNSNECQQETVSTRPLHQPSYQVANQVTPAINKLTEEILQLPPRLQTFMRKHILINTRLEREEKNVMINELIGIFKFTIKYVNATELMENYRELFKTRFALIRDCQTQINHFIENIKIVNSELTDDDNLFVNFRETVKKINSQCQNCAEIAVNSVPTYPQNVSKKRSSTSDNQ